MHRDCSGGEDEAGCSFKCDPGQLACSDGQRTVFDTLCYNVTFRYEPTHGLRMPTVTSIYKGDFFVLHRSRGGGGSPLPRAMPELPPHLVLNPHETCCSAGFTEFGRSNTGCPFIWTFSKTNTCLKRGPHVLMSPVHDMSSIFTRCDGTYVCPDRSDEENCTSPCRENEVRCARGVDVLSGNPCIWRHHTCDRLADCTDGSDELNCTYSCHQPGAFACANGTIVTEEGVLLRCS